MTNKAGEVFGFGEIPVQIKDNKKQGQNWIPFMKETCQLNCYFLISSEVNSPVQNRAKDHHRATKVGVNLKPSAENLIPTLFKWKLPGSARRATVCGDPHSRNVKISSIKKFKLIF